MAYLWTMVTVVTKKPNNQLRYHLRLIGLVLIAYIVGGWFFYLNDSFSFLFTYHIGKDEAPITPFPISVNPPKKTISDDPRLESFVTTEIASNYTLPRKSQSLLAVIAEGIFTHHIFQQLASPISRTLVIYSGQRTEEISGAFAKILRWSNDEKTTFEDLSASFPPSYSEGVLYPGRYYMEKDSSPKMVIEMISGRFDENIRSRYTPEIETLVPMKDALIIASLIEREAYDFTDMREISGVIWNRLFIDMPLQIDATLQYVRGSNPNEPWWPVPRPADKFLDSPFNTYKNKGLPPFPISNPSIEAVIAALNPVQTDCLFYFHTPDGSFYCSVTYEDHVTKLREQF